MGSPKFEALVHHGARQSCMLAGFARRGADGWGWWYSDETSVGIVQLFFDQMVQQLTAAAPREQAVAPLLPENFEHELDASLKALFGR